MAGLTGKNEVSITLEKTLVVDTSAYATGDFIGADILEFANALGPLPGRSGIIQWAELLDNAKQAADIDVVLFDDEPATDFSSMDNAAFDPSDADLKLKLPDIAVSTWKNYNDNASGHALNLAINFTLGGTSLWAALVSRGAPTFAATTDLTLRLGILARLDG